MRSKQVFGDDVEVGDSLDLQGRLQSKPKAERKLVLPSLSTGARRTTLSPPAKALIAAFALFALAIASKGLVSKPTKIDVQQAVALLDPRLRVHPLDPAGLPRFKKLRKATDKIAPNHLLTSERLGLAETFDFPKESSERHILDGNYFDYKNELGALQEAVEQGPFTSPASLKERFPNIYQLVPLLAVKAAGELDAGERSKAIRTLKTAFSVASIFEASQGWRFAGAANSAASRSMTLAASIAGSGEFTPTELQQLLDALPKTPTSSVAMETGIPLDLAAQTIPGILDPKIRADEGVYGMETREVTDPAATVRDLNALYLEDLGNLGKPWATRNQTVRDGLIRRTSGLSYSRSDTPLQILRDMLRSKQSNIGGKMLIAEMAQRNNIAWSFVFRQNMHEVVRLQLALAIFRGKHGGTLPRRLEDLVKDGILKELPVDHFTDESFIYDPLREIFYSAGEDMIDSGGSVPATANEKALDYIYTIPTGRGGAH